MQKQFMTTARVLKAHTKKPPSYVYVFASSSLDYYACIGLINSRLFP